MIKVNKSAMHEQNNITFFCGEKFSKTGNYMFEESMFMFAEENLGPTLIEYDFSEHNALDLGANPVLKTAVDESKVSSKIRMNILNVGLSRELPEFDFRVEYSSSFFNKIEIEVLKHVLITTGGFNADFRNVNSNGTDNILGLEKDLMAYIKIIVSKSFLRNNHNILSERLCGLFDPKRYVDTQVVFFLLMTSLSGIARARGGLT